MKRLDETQVPVRKLRFVRETIRLLRDERLRQVNGAQTDPFTTRQSQIGEQC